MARKKTGRGRPQWVEAVHKVGVSKDDEVRLEDWQARCGEQEKGRAYRRALAVVAWMQEWNKAGLNDALAYTEGVLK